MANKMGLHASNDVLRG